MEISSLTGWVIAFSNVVMAGTVIYATFKAKDWLKPKLNEKGLEYVIEYHKELIKIKDMIYILVIHVKRSKQQLNIESLNKSIPDMNSGYKRIVTIEEYLNACGFTINTNELLPDLSSIRNYRYYLKDNTPKNPEVIDFINKCKSTISMIEKINVNDLWELMKK